MNKELLFKLYGIHSPSGHEEKMRKYLRLQAMRCGAQSITEDAVGNLLITKGHADTYPCLAAHMDQVQRYHSADFKVVANKEVCFGYSIKEHEQQGLGADDKNGIFVCLECLRKYDAIKVAFFVGEEMGCIGSQSVDLSFFSDCRFIIQPDRMNGHDLITSMFCGDVCSKEFIADIAAVCFGYKEEVGSITDVGTLVERGVGISCLNLSCGYYEPHSNYEFTVLPELENCLNFVQHIIETCDKVYKFDGDPYLYGGYSSFGRNGYSGFDEDCDRDMMDLILTEHPTLTFDDVLSDWYVNFKSRDIDILRDIYEDTKSYYDSAYWNGVDDDDDDLPELLPCEDHETDGMSANEKLEFYAEKNSKKYAKAS